LPCEATLQTKCGPKVFSSYRTQRVSRQQSGVERLKAKLERLLTQVTVEFRSGVRRVVVSRQVVSLRGMGSSCCRVRQPTNFGPTVFRSYRKKYGPTVFSSYRFRIWGSRSRFSGSWFVLKGVKSEGRGAQRGAGVAPLPSSSPAVSLPSVLKGYRTESVYKGVLQKSAPSQIRQLILKSCQSFCLNSITRQQAGVLCSVQCKCFDCRNTEESAERKALVPSHNAPPPRTTTGPSA
jgi:hypothetical protein